MDMLFIDVIAWDTYNTYCQAYTPQDYCLYLFKSPTKIQSLTETWIVEPHTYVIFDIGATHSYSPAEPNQESINLDLVHFTGAESDELLTKLELPRNTPFQLYNSDYISNLIKYLNREAIKEYSKREITLDILLRSLLFNISKEMYTISSQTPSIFDPYAHAIRDIRKEIVRHPEQNWSIEAMAKSLNISYSHFCKLYKKFHLISPNRDLINIRIQKAQYLLNCRSMSVHDVSQAVGYKSEYHFIRLFTEIVGVSPGKYVKTHRGGNVGS